MTRPDLPSPVLPRPVPPIHGESSFSPGGVGGLGGITLTRWSVRVGEERDEHGSGDVLCEEKYSTTFPPSLDSEDSSDTCRTWRIVEVRRRGVAAVRLLMVDCLEMCDVERDFSIGESQRVSKIILLVSLRGRVAS